MLTWSPEDIHLLAKGESNAYCISPDLTTGHFALLVNGVARGTYYSADHAKKDANYIEEE